MNHCTGMSTLALFPTIYNISGKMYTELSTTFSTATKVYKHTSNQVDIMHKMLEICTQLNAASHQCQWKLLRRKTEHPRYRHNLLQ